MLVSEPTSGRTLPAMGFLCPFDHGDEVPVKATKSLVPVAL